MHTPGDLSEGQTAIWGLESVLGVESLPVSSADAGIPGYRVWRQKVALGFLELGKRRFIANLAKISTVFENAISESLHFQSLKATENGGTPLCCGKGE
jgi:hypothetical protein